MCLPQHRYLCSVENVSDMEILCINKGHSKEYVCIAKLLVYCRRMEVRRSDELKMGIYKCVIIKLLHQNKFVNI